jgi:hypothetical protein
LPRRFQLELLFDDVEGCFTAEQFPLDLGVRIGPLHEPGEGSLGVFVSLFNFGTEAFFTDELGTGVEKIEEGTEGVVDSGEGGQSGVPSKRQQPTVFLTAERFFCSTKQLSFLR